MNQEIFDWVHLLLRWLHMTVGIAWIGASLFFMWLDRSFEKNPNAKHAGHVGDLWMIHGGGFYHVEKLMMGTTQVPEHLHWFKWESYWTFMSGAALLVLIFYTSGGTFLMDPEIAHLTFLQALLIGVSSVVVSWFFYDFLWERDVTRDKPLIGHALTLLWFAGMSYLLCHTLSGRAAYMHIGAMLGTWMTGNVFLRIIPRQVKMVEAAKKGEPVNQSWAQNAKSRSTHNTYFTLPVIFIMLSNHFPATYGHSWNWLILLIMSGAGASIREYFVSRIQDPARAKLFAVVGTVMILGLIASSGQRSSSSSQNVLPSHHPQTQPSAALGTAKVSGIVSLEGKLPPPRVFHAPPGCAGTNGTDIASNELLVNNGRLQNALVWVSEGLDGKTFTDIPSDEVRVFQKNCLYDPRVVVARVGQKVAFINDDPIFHNVRSVSAANENFNLSLVKKNDKVIRVFTKQEILMRTKCNVHPWMAGYIAVMEHPFFSLTNAQGQFSISHLPAGTYTLEVWHEMFARKSVQVTISEGQTEQVNIVFQAPIGRNP